MEEILKEASLLTGKACTEESVFVYVREAFLALEQRKGEVWLWPQLSYS